MANADILNFLQELQRIFLECGVCAELYNEDDHIPRQLPCFHTFCSACLRRLGNRGNKIECSLCKTVHKINQGSTVNFYKDNTRRDLLTFLKENANGNGLAMCSECNEILKLWFTCNSCSIILCPGCKEVHSKQYSRHRIGNAPVSTESDADFVEKCELSGHDNGPLKYICMSSLCQVALCSTCVVESHRDDAFHQLKELKTHVQERKDSLVIDLKSLKDKIVIANSFIMKSKANFDHYRTEKEVLKRKIDKLKEMGLRDSTRTYINDHLTEICRKQEQLRLIVMRKLTNFMTSAEKCRSECKQLLGEKSTLAFLLVEKTKKEQIDGLLTHELNIFDAKNAIQSINDLLTNEYKIFAAQKTLQQNNQQANRDREQTAFHGYNNRHLTCTHWTIILFLAFILINGYIIENIPADRIIGNIKLMTYQFDTSKPSHFACSSFDHKVVSTMPPSAGVSICGTGKFAHRGVFGNKSFAVKDKAKFVLTLTYQDHDFDVHDSKVENKLIFEFGFTLNTIIEDYLYQKENVWAISGYKCHNIYNVCLILTYPNQLNVNIHQSLWLGYEDSVFTKNYNSGTVMGRLTLVLNRKARTLSILTKSRTFHFDLIDDKQVNENVWPVFLIHEIKGVFPLSAKIGKNSRFSYDPSSLPPNYFLSEDNNTVSHIDSTKTKDVNKENRYVYTMPENFQPNVKYLYSRFRIVFKRNQAVTVGHTLFEFGFGIVQNKRFKSLMKIECKTCLTSDGANIGFCLETSLASVTKQTFYEYVDLEWDIFVYFDLNDKELNVLTLPCDTCSYYHQTVSLYSTILYKPHKFYFGRYNTPMMMVLSNLTVTVKNVNSIITIISIKNIGKTFWILRKLL